MIILLIRTTLVVFLAARVYSSPLQFEVPAQLERSRDLGFGIENLKNLRGGGLLVLTDGGWQLLTNEMTTQSAFVTQLQIPFGIQSDGRFVCKGDVSDCVFRINWDGTRDLSFNSPACSSDDLSSVNDVAAQPDGRAIVACWIPGLRPQSTYRGFNDGLFRLNVDGSDDSSFRADVAATVRLLSVLPDGRILVSYGSFLRRLLSDGTTDPSFNRVAAANMTAMTVQSDGKIIIAGDFTSVNLIQRPGIARLNADGTLDSLFTPTVAPGLARFKVNAQKDGGVIVGAGTRISRYFADGRVDPAFGFDKPASAFVTCDVDEIDRVYIAKDSTLFQYSGRNRVKVPPAEIPITLQRSSSIETGWLALQTIPANTAYDYLIPNFPSAGTTFYRTVPAQ
jgi:uncharacterized delta-60 repeat protein